MYRKLDVFRTLLGHVKLGLIIATNNHCAMIRVHIKFYLKKKIQDLPFPAFGLQKETTLVSVIREQHRSFVIK